MSAPWFDPNLYAWIPGTALGVIGGGLGSLAGVLAPRGKAKGLVLGAFALSLVVSAVLLVTAVVAWFQGQPYGVWYGFGLPGLIGTIVMASLFPVIQMRYREAEERRMMAKDLRE